MERLNKITSIVDTGLITTVITERVSIAGFASGIGQSAVIALSGTSLIFLFKHLLHVNPLKYLPKSKKNMM